MAKKYLVFNFKNNPSSLKDLESLINIYKNNIHQLSKQYHLILIPSFLHLLKIQESLKDEVLYGVQNIFWLDKVSITGEITPKMAFNAGARFVLIGHSERKLLLKEDYNTINHKIKTALFHKFIPIICVGEKEKKEEINFTIKEEIFDELNYSLRGINLKKTDKLIIAYEPYWAVNSGLTPSFKRIEEMAKLIKFWLSERFSEKIGKTIPVLYGGSVNSKNINDILSLNDINGILIGSKSGKPNEIKQILNKIKKIKK